MNLIHASREFEKSSYEKYDYSVCVLIYFCFSSMKYLKDKPVRDLREDQFLKLVIAEEDKLLNIVLGDRIRGTTSGSLVDEIKKLFHKVRLTMDDFN